jgi:phage terminase large subunit
MNASRLFTRIKDATGKVVVLRGGTRSGKTVAAVQNAFNWLVGAHDDAGYWSICRKALPSLKATAYRDFLSVCDWAGIYPEHNRSELTFSFGPRTVEFFSLDDEQKVRSRKRRHLHLCEANEIDFETFTQLILRTNGQVLLDFNPDIPDHWIRTEIEEKRASEKGDVTVIVSTYLDNPFLSAEEVAEIEYLKSSSPMAWEVFGLGNYGKIAGQVFPRFQIIEAMPDDLRTDHYGIDFGFAVDPCAVVRVGTINNRLYLDELIYERGLNNLQLADRLNLKWAFVADSAEPKSIDELQRRGLSVVPSLKGPDSIRAGIQRMAQFELHVTGRSTNLLKELRLYRVDDRGNFSAVMNHAIDAARYVVQTKLRPNNEFGKMMRVTNYGSAVR